MIQMNLFTKQKQTYKLREGIYGCQNGEERREGVVREFEMDMYTLLHLKWVTNKDLELCSMLCDSLDGGEFGGNGYTCVTEPLCCPLETITTLLTGCIPIQNKKVKKRIYVFCF